MFAALTRPISAIAWRRAANGASAGAARRSAAQQQHASTRRQQPSRAERQLVGQRDIEHDRARATISLRRPRTGADCYDSPRSPRRPARRPRGSSSCSSVRREPMSSRLGYWHADGQDLGRVRREHHAMSDARSQPLVAALAALLCWRRAAPTTTTVDGRSKHRSASTAPARIDEHRDETDHEHDHDDDVTTVPRPAAAVYGRHAGALVPRPAGRDRPRRARLRAAQHRALAAATRSAIPGVLFLDKGRRALPTESTRTTHDFFGSAPRSRSMLAPGRASRSASASPTA